VVAAVNGYALGGGCELALCADVRFAAADAPWGSPRSSWGLSPVRGRYTTAGQAGRSEPAKDLVFTGRFVSAAEALAIGLVDRVVPAEQVLETALTWARQFVGGPTLALRAAKACIDQGGESELATGLELERTQFAALFATRTAPSGCKSFVEHGPARPSSSVVDCGRCSLPCPGPWCLGPCRFPR
jgi:enoyl-CoA hydratase/carnithine racemase